MTKSNKINKVRDLHNFFIKKFRPKKPVILKFCSLKDYRAFYDYNGKRHFIALNKNDNYHTLIDSWTHEIGHMLQKNKLVAKDDLQNHTEEWGKCYAKAYRIYLQWKNLNS